MFDVGRNVTFKVGDVVVDVEDLDVGVVERVEPSSGIAWVSWKTGPDRGKNKWIGFEYLVDIHDYNP